LNGYIVSSEIHNLYIVGIEKDIHSIPKNNLDGFSLTLTDIFNTRMGADLSNIVKIIFHTIAGKDICRVIAGISTRPVYTKEGNITKFYIRSGLSTRDLNVEDAIKYISASKNFK